MIGRLDKVNSGISIPGRCQFAGDGNPEDVTTALINVSRYWKISIVIETFSSIIMDLPEHAFPESEILMFDIQSSIC